MTRSLLGRLFKNGASNPIKRDKARCRRLDPRVDGLESRNLLTAGSVVLSAGLVTITPASTGPNVATVSYQNLPGATRIDVNLNGIDYDFNSIQVGFVYYEGSAFGGAQTFQNSTSLHTVAWGGSGTNLFVSSGSAQDEFFGGSGSNTFDAGSGFDELFGGSGTNVFNESATGSGLIVTPGTDNTINAPAGASGSYTVY
jgi:hypothetical protein